MNRFVIDASIVLKWIPAGGELGVEFADEIYQKIKDGVISVSAPSFLLVEVTNVLLRKKNFSKSEVGEFLEKIQNCGISFLDFSYLKTGALVNLTAERGVSAYDGIYLLLAVEMECKLISDDAKLKEISDLVVGLEKVLPF